MKRCIPQVLFLLLFSFFTISALQAQIFLDEEQVMKQDYFEFTKADHSQTEWYLEWQKGTPNVLKAEQAFNAYFLAHPKEKSRAKKTFNRWLTSARLSMDATGNYIPYEAKVSAEMPNNSLIKTTDFSGSWRMIGPNYSDPTTCGTTSSLSGGFCDRVYINPSNTNNLFAGYSYGGLWVSQDQGASWSLTDANFSNGTNTYANRDYYYGDIEASGVTNTLVFAATEAGLLKSTDSGTTWGLSPTLNRTDTPGVRPYYVALSTSSADIVLATFGREVYRSIDGGTTWTLAFDNSAGGSNHKYTNQHNSNSTFGINQRNYNFFGLEADHDDTNVYYLGVYNATNQPCIYKSTDSGASFSLLVNLATDNPTASFPSNMQMRTIPTQPDIFYVWGQFSTGDLYHYNEDGSLNSQNTLDYYMEAGDINWTDETNIYASKYGVSSVMQSYDNGASFTDMTSGYGGCPKFVHPDVRDIDAVGDVVLIASDGGIAISTDAMASVNSNIAREVSSIDLWGFSSSSTSDILSAGCDHGPTKIRRFDGDNGWLTRGGGDAGQTSVNQTNDRWIIYDHGYGKFKTELDEDNNILTTEAITSPISLHRVAFHPTFYKTAYGTSGTTIQFTRDNFTSFSTLHDFSATVNRVLIAPSDTLFMYALTGNNTVHKSSDGGSTWSTITPSSGETNISDIAVGDNENHLWASYGNFQTNTKVMKSTDGGLTWSDVSSPNLPDTPVSQIVYQRGTDGGVYLAFAGQSGVYYRNNVMAQFEQLGNGLPMMGYIRNIYAVSPMGKYRMGSSRGAWEHDLYEESTNPIAAFSVETNTSKCPLAPIKFRQNSVHSSGTASYLWTFENGTPATSTDPNPSVIFGSIGQYDVSLKITDEFGNIDTKTMVDFIDLQSSICGVEDVAGRYIDLPVDETNRLALTTIPITGDEFTITAWVKVPQNQNSFAQIVSTNAPNTRFGLGFAFMGYTANTNLIFTSPDVPYGMTSSINLEIDKWHYITLTYSPTQVKIYLDGQEPWIRNGIFQSVDFSQADFFINNDIHNQSGNYKGNIDELTFFDYALSQEEIREKRHLVKDPMTDATIKAYYQFNQYDAPRSTLYETVSGQTATILSSILPENSPIPVATGTVHRIAAVGTGSHDFTGTGARLNFPTSAPNDEVIITRLDGQAFDAPTGTTTYEDHYWVINNYGTNTGLAGEATFTAPSFVTSSNATSYVAYKREDNGYETWSEIATNAVNNATDELTFQNIDGFSQFVMANKPIVLPIELLSFEAYLDEKVVQLEWETAFEEDNQGFEIKRSQNESDWLKIAWQNSLGDTQTGHPYEYIDMDVESGNSYSYQLKQIDLDGNTTFSPIRQVRIAGTNYVTISPNPTKDVLQLIFNEDASDTYELSIYDETGRLLRNWQANGLEEGTQKIDLRDLTNGVYLLTVRANGRELETIKFVKQS